MQAEKRSESRVGKTSEALVPVEIKLLDRVPNLTFAQAADRNGAACQNECSRMHRLHVLRAYRDERERRRLMSEAEIVIDLLIDRVGAGSLHEDMASAAD